MTFTFPRRGKLRVTLAIFRARICVLALLAAIPVLLVAQQTRLKYPETRKVETIDNYNGTKVADPYRWLEEIDSKEAADWIKSENGITTPYLAALPARAALQAPVTTLCTCPR